MAGESRHRQRSKRVRVGGQATVEFVLALPVVVLFALTVVQIALIGMDSLLVGHAAREGARAAAVEPSVAAARAGVWAGSSLDPGRTTVSLSGGTNRGDHLTVTVTHRSATNVPIVGALVPDIELSSSVSMRVE